MPPNSHAPSSTRQGRQVAKTTSASAIQPRAGRHVLDPQRRVGDRQIGAGKARHRAAEQHGEIADPDDRIADRMRRLRRFADACAAPARLGAVEEPA